MREMEIVTIFGGRSWGAFNVWSQKQEKLKCWFSKFHFLLMKFTKFINISPFHKQKNPQNIYYI